MSPLCWPAVGFADGRPWFLPDNGGENCSHSKHVSGSRDRAPDFESARHRKIRGVRKYFAGGRIDLSLERQNRNRKRNTGLFQAQRRSTISVSRKTAFASSLRSSRNDFCSGLQRLARIFALGCRELWLAAPTFLANEINCDASGVSDSGYGDDLHGEA